MNCKDLMVGDWVSYCGFYNKVIYIGQKVSMYNGKGTEFTTDPEHIRPIPLTEEILVKNGFEYAYNEVSEMQNKQLLVANIGSHYIEIRLDKRNVAIWYDYDEDGDSVYSDVLIDLPYHVHTFQHLLRLAGIEKELTI